jgi:hypothetical protein
MSAAWRREAQATRIARGADTPERIPARLKACLCGGHHGICLEPHTPGTASIVLAPGCAGYRPHRQGAACGSQVGCTVAALIPGNSFRGDSRLA